MTQAAGRPGALPREAAIAEEAIRAVFKAQRAQQMYNANSPARVSALALARQLLDKAWEIANPLVFQVRRHHLEFEGHPVLAETGIGGDGLAWLLYREGIREVRFTRGFAEAELEVLLDILGRARMATIDQDDLVTMLWLADLAYFTYRHVEVVLEATTSSEVEPELQVVDEAAMVFGRRGPGFAATPPGALQEELGDQPEASSPPIALQRDDDGELYLDEAELDYLQRELVREYGAWHRTSVVYALLDIVEMDIEEGARLEAVAALDELLVEFLGSGQYTMAADLLADADRLLVSGDLDATLLEAVGALAARVSAPGVLRPLLQVLTDPQRAPSAEVLDRLFAEVQPAALVHLAEWLALTLQSPVRARVERVALGIAEAHPSAVAAILVGESQDGVRGALALAGRLPHPSLVPALCQLCRSPEPALRAGALAVLGGLDGPEVPGVVLEACADGDRAVRMAAYRIVAARRLAMAREPLQAVVAGGAFAPYDFNERVALFEALGAVAGPDTVELLDRLLHARGLLGPKEPADVRACAARGLGVAQAVAQLPAARGALERAAGDKDPLVLRTVRLALGTEGAA